MNNPNRETALITGASAGIGAEIARVFAREGFHLVLVARRQDQLEALAGELEAAHGVSVRIEAVDLAEAGAPQTLFETLQNDGVRVDVLVNNAGILFDGNFYDIALEDHLRLLQVNLAALVAMTHLFLAPMRERKHGRIINISSTSAFQPVPALAVYAASKAFVLSMTEALSEELKGQGITATAVCPGFTATDMVSNIEDERWGKIADSIAMAPGQVAEETFRACMKGRVVHVNGPLNRVAASFIQYQPRWLVRSIVGYSTRSKKKG